MVKKTQLENTGPATSKRKQLNNSTASATISKKIVLVANGQIVNVNDARFSFTVPNGSITSAGVFYNGNLVRVLWSNDPSKRSGEWNGQLDDLTFATDGTYVIKVLSSQISYEWEGVIGNTSFIQNGGTTIHRGYQYIRDAVEVGNFMYYVQHFVEGASTITKFAKATPQTKVILFDGTADAGTMSEHICTDGIIIYYSNIDVTGGSGKSWINGINASNDTRAVFSSGTTNLSGHASTSTSAINVLNDSTNLITGLAVQKTGNYLFASYNSKNLLYVFNKTTGAFIRTLSITGIKKICVDRSDNLLVIVGGIVTKYPVNTDGTLGTSLLTITGLSLALAVTVSTDDSTIMIADGGTSQQVKAYSNSNGTSSWSIGTLGGYSTNSVVNTNKFYFSDLSNGVNNTFIATQADGSIWIGDSGNYRLLRFDSTRTYSTQIAYIINSYCSAVDANDGTRIFDQYLEYKVDYTKSFDTCWVLANNWRNQIPADYFGLGNPKQSIDMFGVFTSIVTLSNGRTYGFIKRYADNRYDLIELIAGGSTRLTNYTSANPVQLGKDGALYRTLASLNTTPKTNKWFKKPLTSFDGSNNPVWGTEVQLATVNLADTDPMDWSGYASERAGALTDSNLLVQFQAGLTTNAGTANGYGYHLGAVPINGTGFKWKTFFATTGKSYQGDYPKDAYDIGNHQTLDGNGNPLGFGGGKATILRNLINVNYFGEFWKGGQTNWNHLFVDNGLMVGVFGTDSSLSNKVVGFPGMAGGVQFNTLVAHPTDTNIAYLYHAEEGGFSGIHRWKITGLSTIQVQDIVSLTIQSVNPYVLTPTGYIDLLTNLPRIGTITSTTGNPRRTSTEDISGEFVGNVRSIRTNIMKYDRFSSPDIYYKFSKNNETEYLIGDLPSTNSSNWDLKGIVHFRMGNGNDGDIENTGTGGCYFEVLDNNNKVIIRFYQRYINTTSPNKTRIYANSTILKEENAFSTAANLMTDLQSLSIKNIGGVLSVTFMGVTTNVSLFDSTTNLSQPSIWRITMFDKGLKRDRALGLMELGFKNN